MPGAGPLDPNRLPEFTQWLAGFLAADAHDVDDSLHDRRLLHFLVAWSLFESSCFDGCFQKDQTKVFAARIVNDEGFAVAPIAATAKHFHDRYQDPARLRRLLRRDAWRDFRAVLKKDFDALAAEEKVFLVAAVTYTLRSNLFLSHKGVQTWQRYGAQFDHCIAAMQVLLTHTKTVQAKQRSGPLR
jgi:hypothetical protein